MRLHSIVVVLFFAIGCQQGTQTEEQKSTAALPAAPVPARPQPATQKAAEPMLDPASLKWEGHSVRAVGVNMGTIAGVDVLEGSFNMGANYVRQDRRPLMIALWYGEGRTIEDWRRGLTSNAELGPETAIEVCGQPAHRQEARLAASRIRIAPSSMALDQGTIAQLGSKPAEPVKPQQPAPAPTQPAWRENPARTMVAIGFERNATPVIITYSVETDQREAFRSHEDRFFASIKCD